MGWFRRRRVEKVETPDPYWDDWDGPERSLLEIEEDPEMQAAQADVDAEPLTPRSPRRKDDGLAW